jgi:hypothetical protein
MRKILSIALLCTSMLSWGWGQKGHDVTAYIAEQHLSPKTKAAVDSLLEGKSMVYWANWLDNASHTNDYAYSKTWHYKNVDADVRYEEAQANPSGDAVTAIKSRIDVLNDAKSTFADKQLALKMLLHIMGDLHQPMHMGHATDLGGNRTKVKYFGKETNLHTIWDTNLVESAHKWSYSEWQQQIDRLCCPNACAAITAGSLDDWAKETMAITTEVYNAMPEGTNISYNEIADWTPTIENQLLKGGLRLAYILNSIFDK